MANHFNRLYILLNIILCFHLLEYSSKYIYSNQCQQNIINCMTFPFNQTSIYLYNCVFCQSLIIRIFLHAYEYLLSGDPPIIKQYIKIQSIFSIIYHIEIIILCLMAVYISILYGHISIYFWLTIQMNGYILLTLIDKYSIKQTIYTIYTDYKEKINKYIANLIYNPNSNLKIHL